MPIVEMEDAVRHADDNGWDYEWSCMTPEQIVEDMRRYVPRQKLAEAFVENPALYSLWAQWRIERMKGDYP